MIRYIAKRVLFVIPTVLAVIFIVFTIMNLMPGDPGRIILGRQASQEEVDKINNELGYYDNFFVKFYNYIARAVTLDFGKSYRTNQPVFQEILPKFPTTLRLAVLSTIMVSIVGISLGIITALKQYTVFDFSTTVVALVFVSLPGFLLGLLMILLFSIKFRWLPPNGIGSWKHYVLPVVSISLPAAAMIMRLARATMLEVLRQEYIRTAKSKGASKGRVVFRHALKNTLLPLITVIGMRFASLLGGTVISEIVFGLPGIGQSILIAINNKDVPVVMASTLFLATLFCLIMLFVDILYAVIDPRVRAKYARR